MDGFQFTNGDVVLAEWSDKLFYAKILHIDRARLTCTLLFDDDSVDDCPISKIHSVTETTADIVCIICKDGSSSRPNEIVLCDKCGVGYHQKCHDPFIKDNALEPEAPWMCVYCTNGSDCPYLLNPFELKLKNFTTSSSKQKTTTKDNHYNSDRKTDFRHDNRTDVRTLMDDYCDGPCPRPGIEASRSRARHMLGDHRNVSCPGIPDHRIPANPGTEFYPYPGSYDRAAELLRYRHMESMSKRRRMSLHQKQRATQDVWDNGYTLTRDGMKVHERVDAKNKAAGKDGPREKQRLTQDLERQRKKLKEDMERGQELQREHNQLLTRDLPRSKSDVVTAEDEAMDLEAEKPGGRDKRLYSQGNELTGVFSASSLENSASSSEDMEASNLSVVTSKANETTTAEHRDLSFNENVSVQQTLNGADLNGVEKDLRRHLDACACDGTETEAEMSGQRGNKRKNKEDLTQGFVAKISDTQCEHSSPGVADGGECDTKPIQFAYENISSASSDNASELVVDHKDELKYTEAEMVETSDGTKDRVFTSEKVEVIGRSDDLSSTACHEEINKERQSVRGRPKKTSSQGKGGGKAYKKSNKSTSCVGKTHFESGKDVCDDKGSFQESRTIRKTKEGSGGRLARSKTDKESWRESKGSSGVNQQSISNNDKATDAQEGRTQERARTKTHGTTLGTGVKNDHDMEAQNVITQNRVRSDLPRHNWLIERLLNEKKLPHNTCAPSTGVTKDRNTNSTDAQKDSKGEVTSTFTPENLELVKAPAHSTTSPVSDHEWKEQEVQIRGEIHDECPKAISKEEGIKKCANYHDECLRAEDDNVEGNPNETESEVSNLKVLSPKTEVSSPPDLNNLSPELQRFSPTLVPASPCEEADELKKRPSPLLKVPNIPRSIFEDKRLSPSSDKSSDGKEVREENKNFSLDRSERAGVAATLNERQSAQDRSNSNSRIMVNVKPLNEKQGDYRDERVIEIKSDEEGNEQFKQCNEQSREPEASKISTGRSVNPVSPFLRSERRPTDELKASVHGTPCLDMTPRGTRMSTDLPSSLHFMNPGCFSGYSSRTFTPHLITHNPSSTTGMSAPVSPIAQLPGKSSIRSHLPGQLELGGHSKPDLNCPYHGKKAAEKLIRHAPGYPIIPGDHAHVLSRIPLHDRLPDAATLKMRDKLREQAEFAGESFGLHRPLTSVYDNHRHLVMPHGIHAHAHYPRYLGPGIIDDYGFQLERERFKRKMETDYLPHERPKHTFSTPTEEHPKTSKYITSPSEERENASKRIASPLSEGDSDSARTLRSIPGATTGHCHFDRRRDVLHPSRRLSPQEAKYFKEDHSSHCDLNSSGKTVKYSPTSVRPPSYTPPSSSATKDHPQLYIQLGKTKRLERKSGTDTSLLRPSPPDQESITRHFQERFNILNRKFMKEMEATVNLGDDGQRKREGWLPPEGNVPSGHRRLGPEFSHRRTPPFAPGHTSEGIARPVDEVPSPSSRKPELSKFKDYEYGASRATRNSPPGLTMSLKNDRGRHEESETPRPTVNVSPHKPTLTVPSYGVHGDVMSSIAGSLKQRRFQLRDGMKRSPVIPGLPYLTSHAEYAANYEHIPWPLKSPGRMGASPATRINSQDNQRSPVDRSEREKVECSANEREMEEKEIDLARQKHRINLAHLEHERRAALINNERSHSMLTSLNDERREERKRPDNAELVHRSHMVRDEGLRRDWEEVGSKKRKLEEMGHEVLAKHGRVSPNGRTAGDLDKKLNTIPKDDRIPPHSSFLQPVHEHIDPRTKEQYLSMYGNPRGDPYGHVTPLPFSGRGTNAGNAPFFMSRFDLPRTNVGNGPLYVSRSDLPRTKHKRSIAEATRKQREFDQDQLPVKILNSNEKDLSAAEPAKKRSKPQRSCGVCSKEASFLCSGCQKAWYCSPECQLKAWTEHSKECSEGKRR